MLKVPIILFLLFVFLILIVPVVKASNTGCFECEIIAGQSYNILTGVRIYAPSWIKLYIDNQLAQKITGQGRGIRVFHFYITNLDTGLHTLRLEIYFNATNVINTNIIEDVPIYENTITELLEANSDDVQHFSKTGHQFKNFDGEIVIEPEFNNKASKYISDGDENTITVQQIIELKNAGISDDVIEKLLENATLVNDFGSSSDDN